MSVITYQEAYQEISEILSEIEHGEIPLETLPEKVKRAGELIAYCQDKLRAISNELDHFEEE